MTYLGWGWQEHGSMILATRGGHDAEGGGNAPTVREGDTGASHWAFKQAIGGEMLVGGGVVVWQPVRHGGWTGSKRARWADGWWRQYERPRILGSGGGGSERRTQRGWGQRWQQESSGNNCDLFFMVPVAGMGRGYAYLAPLSSPGRWAFKRSIFNVCGSHRFVRRDLPNRTLHAASSGHRRCSSNPLSPPPASTLYTATVTNGAVLVHRCTRHVGWGHSRVESAEQDEIPSLPNISAGDADSGDTARPTSAPGSEDQRTLDKYALSSAHLPTFSATPHSPMARDAIIGNSLTPTVPVHAGPPASPSHVQNHTVSPPPASTASRMDAAFVCHIVSLHLAPAATPRLLPAYLTALGHYPYQPPGDATASRHLGTTGRPRPLFVNDHQAASLQTDERTSRGLRLRIRPDWMPLRERKRMARGRLTNGAPPLTKGECRAQGRLGAGIR
ncbi:hypothetical protein BD779DRAFT_1479939 [Infundibulicybe gibba]|nr:hypothetical protein BD779DRAFT_1479939 [Infundibulicybe gibba]